MFPPAARDVLPDEMSVVLFYRKFRGTIRLRGMQPSQVRSIWTRPTVAHEMAGVNHERRCAQMAKCGTANRFYIVLIGSRSARYGGAAEAEVNGGLAAAFPGKNASVLLMRVSLKMKQPRSQRKPTAASK